MIKYRFYEKELPEVNDTLFVEVTEENEYGFNVKLLEYADVTGFVSKTQLVKKRTRKKHIIKVGDQLPVVVLNVNLNSINLSKSRVHEPDVPEFMKQYTYASYINRIICEMHQLYKKNNLDLDLDKLCTEIIWPTVDKYDDDHNEAYNYLVSNFDNVFKDMILETVLNTFHKYVVTQNMVLEQDVNLLVLTKDGVNIIKELFNFNSTDNLYKVTAHMISPPLYKITVEGPSVSEGKKLVQDIVDKIQQSVNAYKQTVKFSYQQPVLIKDKVLDLKPVSKQDLGLILI